MYTGNCDAGKGQRSKLMKIEKKSDNTVQTTYTFTYYGEHHMQSLK